MKNFNMGSLASWRAVGIGELLDFPIPENGYRAVAFDLISDAPVSVRVISGDEEWLVARGDGFMTVKFAIDMDVAVVVLGEGHEMVSIRTHVGTQVIPESVDASYTTIEPRPSGPSEDVKKMMQFVKLNALRRERALMDEIRSLTQQREVIDPIVPSAAPSPAPSPASSPSQEGGAE